MALKSLSKENEYEKKIHELDLELKLAKEHLRKVNTKKREDERFMKAEHDQLMALEDKCRKMAAVIKEKKKKKFDEQQKKMEIDIQKEEGIEMKAENTVEDLQNL